MSIFPKEVSFKAWIFVLSAIPFFYNANEYTMSKTLDMDLSDLKVEEKLITESIKLLSVNN